MEQRTQVIIYDTSIKLHHFRALVVLQEDYLGDIMSIVKSISRDHIISMRRQGRFYYEQYFSSLSAITMATLQILNDRVFPYDGKKYEEWNEIPYKVGF